ncbi:stalk domain-containing protein [Paenibacillus chitinolyticus]|uniref:stalk domain-containing protein n=1 Tax=Paenibacillus chitinolyticus TaxID=79263 RepID=UPI0035E25DDF
MFRRFVLILITITVFFFTYVKDAKADEPIRVFINGYQVAFTQLPIVENGTTLVQFRPLFESLNYKLTWNQEKQSITAINGNTNIELTIGSNSAFVNTESSELTLAPRIINGDTFVPLRFVGEVSGGDVTWEQNTNHVDIVTDKGYYLIHACLDNDLDKVKYWLDQEANPNYYSHMDSIPLEWAIHHHNTDMAKLLLKYKADPNYEYNFVTNLLHTAIYYKNPDMVQVLIDGGADIWKKNSEGNAALAWTNFYLEKAQNETDKNNLLKIQSKLLDLTNKQAKMWSLKASFDSRILEIIRQDFKGDIGPFSNEKSQVIYGLKLSVKREATKETVNQLRNKLTPLGYKVFRTGDIFENRLPEQVVIIKGTDADFLKQLGEIGAIYDADPVIKQLDKWNTSTKLEVASASSNWVVVQLLEKPKDFLSFAKEVYAFNPDYVDRGTGSVETFAKEIEKAQGFILWWPN